MSVNLSSISMFFFGLLPLIDSFKIDVSLLIGLIFISLISFCAYCLLGCNLKENFLFSLLI